MFACMINNFSGTTVVECVIALSILFRLLYHFVKQRGRVDGKLKREENTGLINQAKALKTIPSAPWIPILGSLPFLGHYPHRTMAKWGNEKRYESVFRVRIGPMNAVILNDLESIRDGFVRQGHRICGRQQTSLIREITRGNGIVFVDYGTKWKGQRKFGHKAFRKIGLNNRTNEIAEKESQMLVRALEKQLFEEGSVDDYMCGNYKRLPPKKTTLAKTDFNNNDGWKTVDPEFFSHKATANAMCSLLFGRSFGKNDEEFNAVLEETPIQARKSFAVFVLVFSVPCLRNVPPFKGVIDEALCLRKATFKMISELVDEHVVNFTGAQPNGDFVDCFLEELVEEMSSEGGAGIDLEKFKENVKSDFTYDQLLTYAFDIFTAGAETTADTINWGLLYLAKDPKLQSEIRNEIISIAGEDKFPSIKLMSEMQLAKAAVHETLRIRPINTLGLAHTATRRCAVVGFNVPKDSVVLANFWGVHHNPEVFPNPDVFDPRRHIRADGKFVPSNHVITFSAGPRHCLGKRIAEALLLSVITTIVRNFAFRLPKTWRSDKNCYATVEPDMNGKIGSVLIPPEYELEWKRMV